MNRSKLILLAFLAMSGSALAGERCNHVKETEAPQVFMGSPIAAPSDVVVIGDCDKSYDELHEEYVNSEKIPMVQHGTTVRCSSSLFGSRVTASCNLTEQ